MKKQKYSPLVRFLLRTLMLMLSVAGALMLVGGLLMLCEDPLAYAGVGAVCALMLVGFFYGLICSHEEGFLYSMLPPLCISLVMLLIGIITTKGQISLSPILNHLFFLVCAALGRAIPKHKRHKHR